MCECVDTTVTAKLRKLLHRAYYRLRHWLKDQVAGEPKLEIQTALKINIQKVDKSTD